MDCCVIEKEGILTSLGEQRQQGATVRVGSNLNFAVETTIGTVCDHGNFLRAPDRLAFDGTVAGAVTGSQNRSGNSHFLPGCAKKPPKGTLSRRQQYKDWI